MGPVLDWSEIRGVSTWLLICQLNFISLTIQLKHTLGADVGGMADPGNLSSQKMPFFSWEGWYGVDSLVKITCKLILHHAGNFQLEWKNIR